MRRTPRRVVGHEHGSAGPRHAAHRGRVERLQFAGAHQHGRCHSSCFTAYGLAAQALVVARLEKMACVWQRELPARNETGSDCSKGAGRASACPGRRTKVAVSAPHRPQETAQKRQRDTAAASALAAFPRTQPKRALRPAVMCDGSDERGVDCRLCRTSASSCQN